MGEKSSREKGQRVPCTISKAHGDGREIHFKRMLQLWVLADVCLTTSGL